MNHTERKTGYRDTKAFRGRLALGTLLIKMPDVERIDLEDDEVLALMNAILDMLDVIKKKSTKCSDCARSAIMLNEHKVAVVSIRKDSVLVYTYDLKSNQISQTISIDEARKIIRNRESIILRAEASIERTYKQRLFSKDVEEKLDDADKKVMHDIRAGPKEHKCDNRDDFDDR